MSMLIGSNSEHVTQTKPIRSFHENFPQALGGVVRTKEGRLSGVSIPSSKEEPSTAGEVDVGM